MLRITTPDSKQLIFDNSGNHGRNGSDGISGSGSGGNGTNGQHGTDGQSAGDIYFSLSTLNNYVYVNIADQKCKLPLGDSEVNIITKVNGGNGGYGGDGGRGGAGHNGCNGSDATQWSSGSNGEDGGPGGNGGNGGAGGNGGDAGKIIVNVKKEDTDLLMLMTEPEFNGGLAGPGGSSGRGGSGGAGGRGGSSYTWAETHTHHTHDHEGHSHEHTHVTWHSNPGGSDGSTGSSGHDGASGYYGKKGKDGFCKIIVSDDYTYSGKYDLVLHRMDAIQSDDGIIEPGEDLNINNVTFKNTGLMPTPTYHPIYVSLIPNHWIDFDNKNTLVFSSPIPSSETMTLDTPLHFRVKKSKRIPALNSIFYDTAQLQFNATVARVNKSFQTVPKQIQSIAIRYPIEMSIISLPPTISKEEEAPFAIKLQNISNKPVGLDAKDARAVEIELSLKKGIDGAYLLFHDLEGYPGQTFGSPIHHKFPLINPGKAAYFVGTLRFHPETPSYTKINLVSRLQLGNINQPGSKSDTIQQRDVTLQLADSYSYDPHADFLLVTNNETDHKTIAEWQNYAAALRTSMSIWNTSLYSGLSYQQKRYDQKSFLDEMSGKVIIILNNEMKIDHHKTRSTNCLDEMEPLSAAKIANVSTYVIGQHFNVENAILPLTHVSTNDQKKVIKDKFIFWRTPNHLDLKRKAEALSRQVHEQYPDRRYATFYDFNPIKKTQKCTLRPTWELGSVEIRETLDKTHSHIAFRKDESHALDPVGIDKYNILKLLPFDKKLKYLDNAIDLYHAEIIKNAILSDLTEELLAFGKYKWNGDFSRRKLTAGLVHLNTLAEYQFIDRINPKDLLLRYEYVARRLPTRWDKYVLPFFCRRIRLRNICHEKIHQLETRYFPGENLAASRRQLQEKWRKVSRVNVLKQFSKPYLQPHSVLDSQLQFDESRSETELFTYRPFQSRFTENRHFFASMEARKEGIETYKAKCSF